MTTDKVRAIAARIARPIPEAPRPVPKPVKAWQGLVVDQLLTTREDWMPNPKLGLIPWGTTVKVTTTTNAGATLTFISPHPDVEPSEAAHARLWMGERYLLTDKAWRVYLKRVPKPRVPKPRVPKPRKVTK